MPAQSRAGADILARGFPSSRLKRPDETPHAFPMLATAWRSAPRLGRQASLSQRQVVVLVIARVTSLAARRDPR